MTQIQHTLVLLKPDALERGLCGEILRRFEAAGLRIGGVRWVRFDVPLLNRHYAELRAKHPAVFARARRFFIGKPVMAVRISGVNAIAKVRALTGPTDCLTAPAGTIRGDLSSDSVATADAADRSVQNLIHASDSPASARRELRLWFPGRSGG
ncbi:MAG: nucleoside-diphosphate kinase [Verrucomicrobia bacterium]|jgi:nucleoside-diphosphate kinase|nr:nucleoside-diphosphate kinase [Verrucomicrobiota bacterium]